MLVAPPLPEAPLVELPEAPPLPPKPVPVPLAVVVLPVESSGALKTGRVAPGTSIHPDRHAAHQDQEKTTARKSHHEIRLQDAASVTRARS